jgi:HAD superfamily hydrolase (TIGR01549 family)
MKKLGDIDVVVFDYGNTIVLDPFEDIIDETIEFISSLVKRKKKEVRTAFLKANREVNYPHITHFALEEEVVWNALRKLNVEERDIILFAPEIVKVYRMEYRKFMKKYRHKKKIRDVLDYLKGKGKRLGIISNGRAVDLHSAIEWLGIKKYFEFILSSEEAGVEKPDKKIFLKMLNFFKHPPRRIVYIGDDPLRDVQTPKKLGMKVILYRPPKKYTKPVPWRRYDVKIKEKPDAIIKNLTELKRLF